jgi:thiol-disulfide isomerase/thioredoxin
MSESAPPLETYGPAPELDGAIGWLNTDRPVKLSDLRGKVVLLDFWTYSCINCLHVLPDLAWLEGKYPNELVVIGIHSAKFPNEQDTDHIRQAVLRHEIEHPVANDADFVIWKTYGTRAWPTLCLIDPEGQVVAASSGEGHRDDLDDLIRRIIDEHRTKGTLNEKPVQFAKEWDGIADGESLLFPGKVLIDGECERLFISDSNHHRIVVCGLDGRVQEIIGSGAPGLADGAFKDARFCRPQGMTLIGDTLYVADTDNHAVRAVNLPQKRVVTFGGDGTQGTVHTMVPGRDTSLSSPWDVACVDGRLYIAMAGSHQIWSASLDTARFQPFAGSGMENIVDGPGPSAQLAQPSGLAYHDSYLYFADAEVSGLRRVSITGEATVETLVGKGLFEYGDVAGDQLEARFQHPVGVASHGNRIYIADTYNHRIKVFNLDTSKVERTVGTGKPGCGQGRPAALFEPNDVAYHNDHLYIADTNNHRIAVVDLETEHLRTLGLRF